jgi:sigma54-dependent transcription regulator
MINDNLEKTWRRFSLLEQLGNIGAEVGRAAKWQGKDERRFEHAVEQALLLIDLTQRDPRWRGKLRELAIAKEAFADAALGGQEYGGTLSEMERYFMYYALAARAALI